MVRKYTLPWTAFSLLGAGLLGAGMGLLFARQSGARTRKDIRRLASDLAIGIKRSYEDVGDHCEDLMLWCKEIRSQTAKRGRELPSNLFSALRG